jgi:hypothetical protein
MSPSEVLLTLGSHGRSMIGPELSEATLRALLDPAVDAVLRAAAVDAILTRERTTTETLEACLAASVDGSQRVHVARRLADDVHGRIASLPPVPGAGVDRLSAIEAETRELRMVVSSIEGLVDASSMVAQLDQVDLSLARAVPQRLEVAFASLLAPQPPFERWRAELEHVARRAEVAASRAPEPYVAHWLADIAGRARGRVIDPGLVPPSPPWSSPYEHPTICVWCGAWSGMDWNHCGACGAIRRRHGDPPVAWSLAPDG